MRMTGTWSPHKSPSVMDDGIRVKWCKSTVNIYSVRRDSKSRMNPRAWRPVWDDRPVGARACGRSLRRGHSH
ncbi:hypothetical protein BLAT2472_40417 [Burkholderia latens]